MDDDCKKLLIELYTEVRAARRILGMDEDWPAELDAVSERVGEFLYPDEPRDETILADPASFAKMGGKVSFPEKAS